MRLSESKIKAAILHPEEEVRLRALAYFSRSYSQDETIMPLVIEAVEKYGVEKGFSILRRADDLPQTPATVHWLAGELSKDWDLRDVRNDNYCFAVALLLNNADPRLLKPDFAELRCFPKELQGAFHDRLEMATWDWETGWAAFEQFGKAVRQRGHFRLCDLHRSKRLVEALSRHREMGDTVVTLLERKYRGMDRNLMEWLEPMVAELAGMMLLDEAIPVLVEQLHEDDLNLPNSCWIALSTIANDRVVETIANHWKNADERFRNRGAETLENVHTDLSVQKCMEFLHTERNPDTRLFLASALLGNFADEAITPVRQMVLGDDDELGPEEMDLRQHLAVACAVMGISFPEYDRWYADAVRSKWGSVAFREERIRKNFREDQEDFDPGWEEELGLVPPPVHRVPKPPLLNLFGGKTETPEPSASGRKPVGRNDPCPCGSGKKFKKCCMKKQGTFITELRTPCPAKNSPETPHVPAAAARNTSTAATARISSIWKMTMARSSSPSPCPTRWGRSLPSRSRSSPRSSGESLLPATTCSSTCLRWNTPSISLWRRMKKAGMDPAIIYAFEKTGLAGDGGQRASNHRRGPGGMGSGSFGVPGQARR